jgi:hypothetical protein
MVCQKSNEAFSYHSRIMVRVIPPRDLPTPRMCIIAIAGISAKGVPMRICECGVLGWNGAAVVGEVAGEVWLSVGCGYYEEVEARGSGDRRWRTVWEILSVWKWHKGGYGNLGLGLPPPRKHLSLRWMSVGMVLRMWWLWAEWAIKRIWRTFCNVEILLQAQDMRGWRSLRLNLKERIRPHLIGNPLSLNSGPARGSKLGSP